MSKSRLFVLMVVSMATYIMCFVSYVKFNDRLSNVASRPSIYGNSKQLTNRINKKWQSVSSSDTFQVSTARIIHALCRIQNSNVDIKRAFEIVLRKSHVTWTNHGTTIYLVPGFSCKYFGVFVHNSMNRVLVHNFNDSKFPCQNCSRTA